MAPALKKFLKTPLAFYRRYDECEVSTRAAALAYHTLLAIVPVVGVLFWYLSSLNIVDQWFDLTKEFILQQLNVNSSDAFLKHFNRLTRTVNGKSWGFVGFGFLVYSAWNLIAKFGASLDFILESEEHAKVSHGFGDVILIVRRTLVMLGLPIALSISLALSQWIRRDSWFHAIFEYQFLGPYIALPLAWVGSTVATFLVYYFIPRKKIAGKQALKAALIVGPASEITRYLFGLYNGYAVSVHKIYGFLAVIPMFIMWVQVAWILLLTGALLIRLKPLAKGGRRSG